MRFWVLMRVAPPLIRLLIWLVAPTVRLNWEGRGVWEKAQGKPLVLALWHGDMVSLLLMWRRLGGRPLARRISMLSSRSRDGLLSAKLLEGIGCRVVSGSSQRRGAEALLRLRSELQRGRIVGMAVDGPQGPPHRAKQGAALLSAQTGAPIVAVVAFPSRAWTLRDWARTKIPRPFCTVTVRVAEPFVARDAPSGTEQLDRALHALLP